MENITTIQINETNTAQPVELSETGIEIVVDAVREKLAMLAESTQQCVRVSNQIKALTSAIECLHHTNKLSAVVTPGQRMAMLVANSAIGNLLATFVYGDYVFEVGVNETTGEKMYQHGENLGV